MNETAETAFILTGATRAVDLFRRIDFEVDASPNSGDYTVIDNLGDKFTLIDSADESPATEARFGRIFRPPTTIVFKVPDAERLHNMAPSDGLQTSAVTSTPWGDRSFRAVSEDGFTFRFLEEVSIPDSDLLKLYLEAPQRIRRVALAAENGNLATAVDSHGWTARMLLHHICDGDIQWSSAMHGALANCDGEFSVDWFPPDEKWAHELLYSQRVADNAVAHFDAYRALIAQMISEIPGALDRKIAVRGGAATSVRGLMRRRATHALAHVAEAESLLELSA